MLSSPPAAPGRTFTVHTRVRLGDVSPKGRLRLDGVARLLQDVATDDALDGAPEEDATWVVRRTTISVDTSPRYREDVTITTWCSGYGRRWATRRTSIAGTEGGRVEAEALWIHLHPDTGRPLPLSPAFFETWAEGITDTSVSARRRQPEAPDGEGRPWTVRFTDFDALAHVNNAAYWIPVEEELAARRDLRAPLVAEIEYRDGVNRDDPVELVVADDGPGFRLWWRVGTQTRAAAHVSGQVSL
jgi:acyl-ACP thioesterase